MHLDEPAQGPVFFFVSFWGLQPLISSNEGVFDARVLQEGCLGTVSFESERFQQKLNHTEKTTNPLPSRSQIQQAFDCLWPQPGRSSGSWLKILFCP